MPVHAIAPNPRQPRETFEDEALAALARSIQEVGVLQPVVVRKRDDGYELVAGERRLRAARMAGLATIPAVVRESDETESLREALIENIHREDLAPLELASRVPGAPGGPRASARRPSPSASGTPGPTSRTRSGCSSSPARSSGCSPRAR